MRHWRLGGHDAAQIAGFLKQLLPVRQETNLTLLFV